MGVIKPREVYGIRHILGLSRFRQFFGTTIIAEIIQTGSESILNTSPVRGY